MTREKDTKEIDGHKYLCTMMPIRESHRTFMLLCKTLGGPVVNAIAEDPEGLDGDITNLITVAISVAVRDLEEDVSDMLLKSVFSGVSFVGEGPSGFDLKLWDDNFNRHFHGRLCSIYKVWAWSIQVNYRDFLEGAQSLGADKAKGVGKDVLSSLLTPASTYGA